ncbi:hypothetical protein BCON_0153g00170 [Botryotinia convoluta]|uniref:Uncharacterized protein n=1 Tax=Botryotinia convoluta TaxID=54673 RepID=A0A4Z1HSI4_9HELO|nr:hypothetical protein BCON_0153g00170 [Botryotinia convoluta]
MALNDQVGASTRANFKCSSQYPSKHQRLANRQNIQRDKSPMGRLGTLDSSHLVQNDDLSAMSNADAASMAPNQNSLSEHLCKLLLLPLLIVQLRASALISGIVYHDQYQQCALYIKEG